MATAEKSLIETSTQEEQGVKLEYQGISAHLKDTKFSWFVCTCTFISQVFVLGVLHAFGVFFVEFLKEFDAPKGEAAWIGSLAYGLSMTFGPVTSVLVSRFGYSRVMMAGGVICSVSLFVSSFATSVIMLFFSFSVMYGIGTCMCTSPTMTIIGEYFDRHLSIATGITVSGSSFGTLVMGPLSQAIIDYASWRTAFRIFSGLTLSTVLLNSRIRPLVPSGMRKRQKRNILHDLQIWKNRVFVIWTLSITLVMFGFYIPYVHLVSYAIDQGISPDKASILMLILGATTAVGRIMFGRIVQIGVLNRLHMHQLSMIVTGTMVMLLPIIKSYIGIVIYVVTVGLVDGCYVVLLPILTTSLVGIENSVLAWGFMIGTCSITFTLGPPVAGAIYDATGSYNIAFHCAGIPIVCGALLLFLIPWAQRTSGSGAMLNVLNEYTVQESNATTEPTMSMSFGTMYEEDIVAHSTCSRHTNATVRTTGTSPIACTVSDKSTSTDDPSVRFYSMDVEDALSQLSYNDIVFNDMLRKSRDTAASTCHPAAADSQTSTQSIPRIPPPSDPVRYRQKDSSRQGSVQSPYSGAGSIRERPSAISQASYVITTGSINTDASSLLSGPLTDGSIQSDSLDAVLPTASHLFALTDPLNISQQYHQSPFQAVSSPSSNKPSLSSTRQTNPSPVQIASPGTSIKDPTKDSSNFDQTISDQVSILRETLRSPVQTDSKTSENLQSSVVSEESESRGISLPQSIPSRTTSPEPLQSRDMSPGTSKEFSVGEGQSTDMAEKMAQDTNTIDRFATDNQITVIPGTNPFKDKNKTQTGEAGQVTKLEDLFKPVQLETATATESCFELVETESQEGVVKTKSQTGELDVFKHLFTDDDA